MKIIHRRDAEFTEIADVRIGLNHQLLRLGVLNRRLRDVLSPPEYFVDFVSFVVRMFDRVVR